MAEAGQVLNNLQPHKEPASDIGHRDKRIATLTQLSSFAHSLFVILGWLSTTYNVGLPVQVGPLLLLKSLFSLIVILPSYPVLPRLPCWVLTKLLQLRTTWVLSQSSLANSPSITRWVYPYNILQHTIHILGLPHHMQHRLTYYLVQSRPSPAYIPLHTNILTNFVFLFSL